MPRPSPPLSVALPLGMGAALACVLALATPGSAQDRQAPRVAAPLTTESEGPASVLDLGQTFPSPPDLEPVGSALEDVRRHLASGDTRRALLAAERFVATNKGGRERDAAWLAIGLLHREEARHNLASEAFTKVRAAGGPLAPWGAWYEAEQDLVRGRPSVAIAECDAYAKAWPEGPHAVACQRLIARAHAQLGHAVTARALASTYDEEHEEAEISEQIELALATYWARTAPEDAIGPLQALAIRHQAPLTGRVAEELLADLRERGFQDAIVPVDSSSLLARAMSLRDAKRKTEAWTAFEEIVARSADDPELAEWVEGAGENFAWRTHHWDFLVDLYKRRYEAEGKAEHSWDVFRALDRAGRFPEAAAWALAEQTKHASSKDWRKKEELVARTLLLAHDYAHARELLDVVVARGGWTGRRAAQVAAFATLMEGDVPGAIRRYDAVLAQGGNEEAEARYWRSVALDRAEQAPLAQADRDWIAVNDPWSWYGVLVEAREADVGVVGASSARPTMRPFARDGSWAGPPVPRLPLLVNARAEEQITPSPAPAAPALARVRAGASGFGRLAWPLGGFVASIDLEDPPSVVSWRDELEPPPSYVPGAFYVPEDARELWADDVAPHFDAWPELAAVRDLAKAGLYDLSGPLLSQVYEEWREAGRNRSHPRHAAARALDLESEEWRQLFFFARDHHHTARFTYSLWEDVDDPALADEARRLAYPLAHDRYVWSHAREHDVDPYLVLGLMRQESTYNSIAVSRVGASGAMQIMPRTGHLLADLAHDADFNAGDLEDPVLSVGYGITYLGLLLDRFEGVYPLAVASYNGGPFNVSTWLQGGGQDMPLDVFVEHIPFRETRDYVKKVTSGYAAYLALYCPDDTRIVLPPEPLGDHPDIVDF